MVFSNELNFISIKVHYSKQGNNLLHLNTKYISDDADGGDLTYIDKTNVAACFRLTFN
jgi:hypothetical protein